MSKRKRGRPKKHESGGQISVWFDDKLRAELNARAIVWNCSLSDTVNRLLMLAINGSNEFGNDEEIEIEKNDCKRKTISKSLRYDVLNRDSFTCQYCGRSAPEVVLHVDHIVPVSKGGKNDISNLITSCQDCNLGKSAKPINDHLPKTNERREQIKMMMDLQSDLLKMLSRTLQE